MSHHTLVRRIWNDIGAWSMSQHQTIQLANADDMHLRRCRMTLAGALVACVCVCVCVWCVCVCVIDMHGGRGETCAQKLLPKVDSKSGIAGVRVVSRVVDSITLTLAERERARSLRWPVSGFRFTSSFVTVSTIYSFKAFNFKVKKVNFGACIERYLLER